MSGTLLPKEPRDGPDPVRCPKREGRIVNELTKTFMSGVICNWYLATNEANGWKILLSRLVLERLKHAPQFPVY